MKKEGLARRIIVSAMRTLAVVIVLVLAIGTFGINLLMFHPVKGGYGENTKGVDDIGTNGVRIAVLVL